MGHGARNMDIGNSLLIIGYLKVPITNIQDQVYMKSMDI